VRAGHDLVAHGPEVREVGAMFGVPADLDLAPFVGLHLNHIGLGPHDLRLVFSNYPKADRVLQIESTWELRGPSGEVFDRADDAYGLREEPLHFHRIIGREVTEQSVSAPDWIELGFDNGVRLRVYDDSPHYESFQIQPGDIVV
jgi:hypothetical protein